ncbi:solute carrier family 35 member F2-like [Hibiscus syriacus]|uniref:Solute carrier family 35 member F2-like n=1 Tax=Hibiscus syriacus TaxID=106335 RepID=A0A6A3CR40_HIBSY|nr:solute carrier family 35 member F2-like [Hibiscus syriacus]
MASSAIKEEISQMKYKGEEEDEELFEIDIETVNSIPPPRYWEGFFTATSNALLANCLLPISDISTAVPMVSKACTTLSRLMD